MGKKKGSGYVVKTKTGKEGFIKHSDHLLNGKQKVYCSDGNILVDPKSYKVIGFLE